MRSAERSLEASRRTIFGDNERERLDLFGFVHIPAAAFANPDQEILEVAASLGEVVTGRSRRLVELIQPKTHRAAQPSSLSAKFGHGEFPFHVDQAHYVVPARIIILYCQFADCEVATRLFQWKNYGPIRDNIDLLHRSTFWINNGRNSFYASALDEPPRFLRFDPGCMTALDQAAKATSEMLSYSHLIGSSIGISMGTGDLLIIDNWQTLHARDRIPPESRSRILKRVSIL